MKFLHMKKGIVHSDTYKISVFEVPELIVKNMIEKYSKFISIS